MSMFWFRWNQKSAVLRVIGTLNLFLGVMAAFSALLSVLIVAVHADPHPQRFIVYASLLTAAAASGLMSGLNLVREKPAGVVTFVFGLLLAIFVVTDVLLEHAFPLRLFFVLAYGLTICIISLRIPVKTICDESLPEAVKVRDGERLDTNGQVFRLNMCYAATFCRIGMAAGNELSCCQWLSGTFMASFKAPSAPAKTES